jgi:hypothetical protein
LDPKPYEKTDTDPKKNHSGSTTTLIRGIVAVSQDGYFSESHEKLNQHE